MYGWRAKVGVLVPDGNSTMEPELYRLAPPGVSFHFARLQAGPGATTLDAIIRDYVASAAHAAEAVAKVEPDLIVFGLTAGSFVPASGGNAGIESAIRARTGIPALAAGTCVVEALRAVSVRRLAAVTPYTHDVSERGRRYLEAHGFQVALLHTIAAMAEGVQGIYRLHPERIYREVKMALHGHQVDGIFLSGTGVHSLDIIPVLEADLGLPVVSSNTAVLWSVLRRLGVTPLPGGGRLLEYAGRGEAHVEA